MKRILSLILAALLATSALVACDTTPQETESKETDAPETDPVETGTSGDYTYNPLLVTENGAVTSHIVVATGADQLLTYAAEELAYHIKLVSGAEVATVTEASADSMPIIIATPDTNPELNDLFADDMAWLTTLEEDGKNYGSDGFAIRQHDGKLYIFGSTPRGALNGVYDFIEDNLGVLWIRADESKGLIYDEMPTIAVSAVNYREKSPFEIRGWNLCGGSDVATTQALLSRNKLNAQLYNQNSGVGISCYHLTHNAKWWVVQSPIYDPTVTEYWNTDSEGNPLSPEESPQINYWSDLTVDCVAASLISYIGETGLTNVGIGIEDGSVCEYLPLSNEPFEYAPGQFLQPYEANYLSTVFFTFLNKVARQVKDVYPDVKVNAYAYFFTEEVPLCELEDNICICIAPILEDMKSPITDPANPYNVPVHKLMEAWRNAGVDVAIYNYYGCSRAVHQYERPLWRRIQADLQYYMESGFTGLIPEGLTDGSTQSPWNSDLSSSTAWDMNALSYWIFSKLAWNPNEDVDALIVYFCDKVYGAASEEMQEYYRLIEAGFTDADVGTEYHIYYNCTADYYFDLFVYQMDLEDDIIAALRAAYDAAETDVIKERIRPIKESYEAEFPDV